MTKGWKQLKKFSPVPINIEYMFQSGKYRGYTVKEVIQINPQYLLWIHNHSTNVRFNNDVLRKINKVPKHKRRKLVGDEYLFGTNPSDEGPDWLERNGYWDLEEALFD